MYKKRFACSLLALVCVLSVCTMAYAAEVDCDSTYCFTATDFAESEALRGVCITQLPDASTGTVMLGNRVIRSGDILTADQLAQMTFCPLRTQQDQDAVVTYLPIYDDRVETAAVMTISIRGKEDKAPVAEDFALETYKNLPNQGLLKAHDPEGENLTYTVVRNPKRGEVTVNADGSFTYTPKKNKVGVDSFTYTAADPAGNISRQATVTITILKPSDAKQYQDTVGQPHRFAAEWMRNTGLFVGESVGGESCFGAEKQVSRGEFITMVVKMLEIPVEDVSYDSIPSDTPDWLKPYLAAAMRSGLTANLPENEAGYYAPVTGAEAAVMLQNVLDLSVSQEMLESVQTATEEVQSDIPVWAASSLTAMADNGVSLNAGDNLNRGQVAQLMYQVSKLAENAPGMAVIRMQK